MTNFNPNFDREKFAFLELANRGDGLTPIDNIGCAEGLFGSITANIIEGGSTQVATLSAQDVNSVTIRADKVSANKVSAQLSSDGESFFTLPSSLSADSSTVTCVTDDPTGTNLGTFLTYDGNGKISLTSIKLIVMGV